MMLKWLEIAGFLGYKDGECLWANAIETCSAEANVDPFHHT